MRVAVLGTGIMGTGMARSLLREGLDVVVWNRSAERVRPLQDDGAVVASTPLKAVTGADVVITMLYDEESVLAVVADAAAGFGDGAVWLQSSTIGPAGMARVGALAEEQSIDVLDAPVLGTRKPAEDGALVVLASGAQALAAKAQEALTAIGTRTVWVGDRLGAASALKLVCNAWVATVNAGIGQSIAMAQALELDPALFLDAITGGAVDMPYAHLKGAAMIADDVGTPAFALDGVLKDLGLISSAAVDAGVNASILSALTQVYRQASEDGRGHDDMAAVYTALRPHAGA